MEHTPEEWKRRYYQFIQGNEPTQGMHALLLSASVVIEDLRLQRNRLLAEKDRVESAARIVAGNLDHATRFMQDAIAEIKTE